MDESVVQALYNGDIEARIQAASELCKLTSKQRRKLVDNGVIGPLISMLHSQDHDAIEAALLALLSLAFGSERNKIEIVKSGAIPALLNLLQCQIERLLELTVASMLILSSSTSNKLAIASSRAIHLLVEILNGDYSSSNNTQSKLDAIATLHNLSTYRPIIPTIASSDVIFSLLQQIHISDKSSAMAEKSTALLEHIVSLSQIALQKTAGTGGAIRALVESVEEGSPQCKEHAVGILLLVCRSCREKYRGMILREGAMPGLLQLSVDGSWRTKEMARELLLLLRDCSNYGGSESKSKHELVEQIMQEIDAEGEKVVGTTLRLVEDMIAKLKKHDLYD